MLGILRGARVRIRAQIYRILSLQASGRILSGSHSQFGCSRANTCIRVSETIDGVAALKRYYCQLIFLQNRFHILTIESSNEVSGSA